MNRTVLTVVAVVLAILVVISMSAFYTVHQAQQALVLQFGQPVKVVRTPGLQIKLPFVQNVIYYDKRLLDFDAEAQEVIALDQKRLVVDAFARYRIVDPLRFYQAVGTEAIVRARLGAIVIASVRNVLGSVPFSAVLTDRRTDLMRRITELVQAESGAFGIAVTDVRIMRADLHPDNSPAIYARMQTEREREARQERAEGAETGQRIRAEAERERTVLLADAQRRAQILRGEGDGQAAKIFADAYSQDSEFYAFFRSLQAYRQAFGDGNSTTMVLSPDSEFFKYFRDVRGSEGVAPRAGAAPTPTPAPAAQ